MQLRHSIQSVTQRWQVKIPPRSIPDVHMIRQLAATSWPIRYWGGGVVTGFPLSPWTSFYYCSAPPPTLDLDPPKTAPISPVTDPCSWRHSVDGSRRGDPRVLIARGWVGGRGGLSASPPPFLHADAVLSLACKALDPSAGISVRSFVFVRSAPTPPQSVRFAHVTHKAQPPTSVLSPPLSRTRSLSHKNEAFLLSKRGVNQKG